MTIECFDYTYVDGIFVDIYYGKTMNKVYCYCLDCIVKAIVGEALQNRGYSNYPDTFELKLQTLIPPYNV